MRSLAIESYSGLTMYAYYDREADIAWLPTGPSSEVVSEKVEWGLIDYDTTTDEVVA